MKDRQKRLALMLSMSLMMGTLTGCGPKVEEEVTTAEDVALIEASNPELGSLALTSDFIATIEPEDVVNVFSLGSGEVLSIDVEEGDRVEAGQVLATLDDRIAQIQLKTAQITESTAQLTYDVSYGEAAGTILDMNNDTTLDSGENVVSDNQDLLVQYMDDLEHYESLLRSAEDELKDHRKKYGYKEDIQEIMDYADKYSTTDPDEAEQYADVMKRYNLAVAKDTELNTKITKYKDMIDTLQDSIEKIEDAIDKGYEAYAKTATQLELSNGPLREDQKAISQNTVNSAGLSVESAQIALDNTVIKAPVSGIIESINIDEHGMASAAGGAAFTISQKDAMFATYYVSEEVRNTFAVGQKVSLDKDGREYSAKVTEIGTSVDATTGLFKVKALVEGDVSNLLSGTKATVTTDTYHEDNALFIPYDAVYYEAGEGYVYLAVDGHAKKTFVKTGLATADSIVITEGISKDDVVITTWAAQLRDGVAVSIQDAKQE